MFSEHDMLGNDDDDDDVGHEWTPSMFNVQNAFIPLLATITCHGAVCQMPDRCL
jgi:hypothetical protein